MALLVPDNLKSRKDVTAVIRRTANALQIGLDDNATVWYEPLFDPTGEKPHFVILLPEKGIVVFEALEVKTELLLGAIRGKIRFLRDGEEMEVNNPIVRAEKLAKILRKRISAESRLSDLEIPVSAGAVFTSLSAEAGKEKGLEKLLPLEKCLFKEDIDKAIAGIGEANLLRTFNRIINNNAETSLTSDIENILRGIIQPDIVIDKVAKEKEKDQENIFRSPEGENDIIRIMDRHQEIIAKSLGNGHRIIRGVAGSGKTLLLLYRAKLLSRMYPQNKILVTCYTRSLAGQLRTMLDDFDNIEVVHLDRLMAEAIREAGLRHPGFKNENGEKVAIVARNALASGYHNRFDFILLDEAQDFNTNALRLVVDLLSPGSDDLVIVADAAQNIFRRNFSWKQAGIQAQGRTRILRTNYRNTREILEFASKFLFSSKTLYGDDVPDPEDENALIPPEAAKRTGEKPNITICENIEEEVEKIVLQVKNCLNLGLTPRKIAILYAASYEKRVNIAKMIYERLDNEGVDVFWLNDPLDKKAKDNLAKATESVVLSTIHSSKGLEFPNVILCSIWREGEEIEVNRKIAYVGMTRATNYLSVISQNNHPLVEDLRKALACEN